MAQTAIAELTTKAETSAALNPRFAEWLGFKTFGDPELTKVVQACAEWHAAFKSKQRPRWLSLIGNSGTGKTHCATRLWNWAKTRFDWYNCGCEYSETIIYWPEFVQKLRAGAYEYRDDLKRWPLLFLDDIGSERDPTGFATEELNTLLGRRMGKWTLLTSNLNIGAIKNLDSRMSSRLIRDCNICVGIDTKDFAER